MGNELMSERSTAIFAGVSLSSIQKARKAGKIRPVQEFRNGLGICRLYNAEEVKQHFANDVKFQSNRTLMRMRRTF